MKFNVELVGTASVISILNEKMDHAISPDLKTQIVLTANANEKGALIMDLSKVNFADSSGLSALLLAHRLYRDSNRKLVLCGLTDRVKKLIEIAQLSSAFDIQINRDLALKSLSEE